MSRYFIEIPIEVIVEYDPYGDLKVFMEKSNAQVEITDVLSGGQLNLITDRIFNEIEDYEADSV